MASDPNDEKLVELEKKVDRRKERAKQSEHQQAKAHGQRGPPNLRGSIKSARDKRKTTGEDDNNEAQQPESVVAAMNAGPVFTSTTLKPTTPTVSNPYKGSPSVHNSEHAVLYSSNLEGE